MWIFELIWTAYAWYVQYTVQYFIFIFFSIVNRLDSGFGINKVLKIPFKNTRLPEQEFLNGIVIYCVVNRSHFVYRYALFVRLKIIEHFFFCVKKQKNPVSHYQSFAVSQSVHWIVSLNQLCMSVLVSVCVVLSIKFMKWFFVHFYRSNAVRYI